MVNEDTIAAIATPLGYAGISIIRISGKDAFAVAEKIFVRPNGKSFSRQGGNTITYGHIVNKENRVLDEVLVSKMCAPRTYTAEDVVEINCHGGLRAVKSVLELILHSGARLAEPGEFTKRAFLNGRIDLSQAEAVSDVISAKTELSLGAALGQLDGALSKEIRGIKKEITSLLSIIEVTIQYPEYDEADITDNEIEETLLHIQKKIEALLSTYRRGEILKDGLKVVIAGKPNVGKSMILNALIGKNKAIVTNIPGTTRDVVDEFINISGIPVRIVDTAGIRDSEDVVESIGIEKSLSSIEEADMVLFVTDGSKNPEEEDIRILKKIQDKQKVLFIKNKVDLGENDGMTELAKDYNSISISAKTKQNFSLLEESLHKYAVGMSDVSGGAFLNNQRHKILLEEAGKSIQTALNTFYMGMSCDLLEIDLRECMESLGSIIGETAGEDVINEIFKNFCLGK